MDEDIRATLKHLERLLVRFEIDSAGGLHPIDYGATIELLCADFQQQMAALTRGSAADGPPDGPGCTSLTDDAEKKLGGS